MISVHFKKMCPTLFSYSSLCDLDGLPKGSQEMLHSFLYILVSHSVVFWNDILAEPWFPERFFHSHL